jgi:hypothetical protein
LSFIQRLTACGVAGSFFATDIASSPAASIEARSRAPKGILFFLPLIFRTTSPFRQVKKVSQARPHRASSPLVRFSRYSLTRRRAGSLIQKNEFAVLHDFHSVGSVTGYLFGNALIATLTFFKNKSPVSLPVSPVSQYT